MLKENWLKRFEHDGNGIRKMELTVAQCASLEN
jgi:hypothetical protein